MSASKQCIVNRAKANREQLLLQPVGTLLHVAIRDAQAYVALAGLCILDFNLDRQFFVVDHKGITRRPVQTGFVAVLLQPGIKVAGDTPMAQRIGTVGSDVDLDEPVALEMIVLGCRCSHHGIFRQHDDSCMRSADADFVLSTNHAQALITAQLGALDLEFLVAIVEHTAQIGHNDLLAGGHVRRTTDNLLRLSLAKVDSCQVQMGFRYVLTGQHLSDKKPLQASLDALHFFNTTHLETTRGQRGGNFLGTQVEVNIFFQPLIRNIHIFN